MKLTLNIFVCLLVVNKIGGRPSNDDDVELYNLEDENQLVPSINSRFNFENEEEVAEHTFEEGSFFQGDIKLIDDQRDYLLGTESADGSLPTRTGWISEDYRWPKGDDGYVNFPYELSAKSGFSENDT
jgi:hypothetical protein